MEEKITSSPRSIKDVNDSIDPVTALWCIADDLYGFVLDVDILKSLIFSIESTEEPTLAMGDVLRSLQLALSGLREEINGCYDATMKARSQLRASNTKTVKEYTA